MPNERYPSSVLLNRCRTLALNPTGLWVKIKWRFPIHGASAPLSWSTVKTGASEVDDKLWVRSNRPDIARRIVRSPRIEKALLEQDRGYSMTLRLTRGGRVKVQGAANWISIGALIDAAALFLESLEETEAEAPHRPPGH